VTSLGRVVSILEVKRVYARRLHLINHNTQQVNLCALKLTAGLLLNSARRVTSLCNNQRNIQL
jgi:hypothetical protein